MIYSFKITHYNYISCFTVVVFLFISSFSFSQNDVFITNTTIKQNLSHTQIKIDSIKGYKQFINILKFPNNTFDNLELNSKETFNKLETTSKIAQQNNAIAAVNGGFFNMTTGNLVTYFEKNDSIIYRTASDSIRQSQSDYFLNGAIVINNDNTLYFETAKSDEYYIKSKDELMVLVTGPMLLNNGQTVKLASIPFVTSRHPRTCICTSEKEVFLVTVDGRSSSANGMSLLELQKFLLTLGCKDALNLDGGGSTTMWIKDKGVVNVPSDKNGERPVSNILTISEKVH